MNFVKTQAAALIVAVSFAAPSHAQADKPLIVYVSPNPIDINDFLKLGRKGTQAAAETAGGVAKIYESTDPTTQRQNLEAAAKEGAKVVVAISFQFDDILPVVAAAYPDVSFLQIDSCPKAPLPNVYCAVFREYEGAFLAGAEAALTSKTGKVGAIAGLDIPFMHRFTDGFIEGAKHAKPDIAIVPSLWVGGNNPFSDPARGQQRGSVMAANDVDRVMAAAPGSNAGIYKGLQDLDGATAFGVDVNECPTAPGLIMDNVEKRVDVAIETGVADILKGGQQKVTSLGLAEKGVTLTSLEADVEKSGCVITDYPDVTKQIVALREKIASGQLKIEDPMKLAQ